MERIELIRCDECGREMDPLVPDSFRSYAGRCLCNLCVIVRYVSLSDSGERPALNDRLLSPRFVKYSTGNN